MSLLISFGKLRFLKKKLKWSTKKRVKLVKSLLLVKPEAETKVESVLVTNESIEVVECQDKEHEYEGTPLMNCNNNQKLKLKEKRRRVQQWRRLGFAAWLPEKRKQPLIKQNEPKRRINVDSNPRPIFLTASSLFLLMELMAVSL
ncbi:hypothetical protein V6N13_147552 [Hibiscus sabdariffa]|uniref:Transmembrane protein n=1 Tax=Hibiscus sabdariffa TaxID=183260 RepID=A0ABR2TVV4_9ROSI